MTRCKECLESLWLALGRPNRGHCLLSEARQHFAGRLCHADCGKTHEQQKGVKRKTECDHHLTRNRSDRTALNELFQATRWHREEPDLCHPGCVKDDKDPGVI